MTAEFRRVSRPTGSYLCIKTPQGAYQISEKITDGAFRRLPVNQRTAMDMAEKHDAAFAEAVKNHLDAAQRVNNPRLLLTA